MNWKNLSSWSKGGIIASSLFLLIVLFDFSTMCKLGTSFSDPCGFILMFPTFPFVLLALKFDIAGASFYLLDTILGLITYFIIGALIGWIIEKIKSKR